MNKNIVGVRGEKYMLRIEQGKVAEFAEAIQSDNEAYFREDAPSLPPTFLTTAFFWERRVPAADMLAALDLDASSAVHAEQEYQFFGRPLSAGDVLVCQTRVDKIYEKHSGQGRTLVFAELITDFRDEFNVLKAIGKMTVIEPDKESR